VDSLLELGKLLGLGSHAQVLSLGVSADSRAELFDRPLSSLIAM
jgi:hypothetical protein